MRRLLLISALCSTASCGREEVVMLVPEVPDPLRQPVEVKCAGGDTMAALGACAMKKDAGLREANRRIVATDQILDLAEAGAK